MDIEICISHGGLPRAATAARTAADGCGSVRFGTCGGGGRGSVRFGTCGGGGEEIGEGLGLAFGQALAFDQPFGLAFSTGAGEPGGTKGEGSE